VFQTSEQCASPASSRARAVFHVAKLAPLERNPLRRTPRRGTRPVQPARTRGHSGRRPGGSAAILSNAMDITHRPRRVPGRSHAHPRMRATLRTIRLPDLASGARPGGTRHVRRVVKFERPLVNRAARAADGARGSSGPGSPPRFRRKVADEDAIDRPSRRVDGLLRRPQARRVSPGAGSTASARCAGCERGTAGACPRPGGAAVRRRRASQAARRAARRVLGGRAEAHPGAGEHARRPALQRQVERPIDLTVAYMCPRGAYANGTTLRRHPHAPTIAAPSPRGTSRPYSHASSAEQRRSAGARSAASREARRRPACSGCPREDTWPRYATRLTEPSAGGAAHPVVHGGTARATMDASSQ
jgi:hypothetical protein